MTEQTQKNAHEALEAFRIIHDLLTIGLFQGHNAEQVTQALKAVNTLIADFEILTAKGTDGQSKE